MGETGCGKTRLIRYMCDLARQGMEGTNMLILKVFYLVMLCSFIAICICRGRLAFITHIFIIHLISSLLNFPICVPFDFRLYLTGDI